MGNKNVRLLLSRFIAYIFVCVPRNFDEPCGPTHTEEQIPTKMLDYTRKSAETYFRRN